MAQAQRQTYREDGSAAYDVYRWNGSAVRQPRPQPQRLPEERLQPQRRTRVRARTAIAPFSVAGLLTVACLMVLVIFGYVQLFEATSEVSRLKSQLNALSEQQLMLQSKYDAKVDLDAAQTYAEDHGLNKPLQEQVVYVNLSGADQAEIFQYTHTGVLEEVFEAMRQSVTELIAYLRTFGA